MEDYADITEEIATLSSRGLALEYTRMKAVIFNIVSAGETVDPTMDIYFCALEDAMVNAGRL